jgi:peptidyl-prolyl cis-trans isomerase C
MRIAIAGLALAVAVHGCGGEESPQDGEVLAVVDGKPLTAATIRARLETMDPDTRSGFDSPSMLSQLIRKEIDMRVWARAAMDEGIQESEAYELLLEEASISILAELYTSRLKRRALEISDQDLLEAYERDKHLYSVRGSIHARHILCETEDKAKEALGAIQGGMSFEEAVAEFSTDKYTVNKGGDLGRLNRETPIPGLGVSPDFYESLSRLQPGEVGGPISTVIGFHIAQVVDRREDVARPFSEVKANVEKRLRRDIENRGETDDLVRLWEKYNVTVDEIAIKRLIGFPTTPEEFIRLIRETTGTGDKINLSDTMTEEFPDNRYTPYAQFVRGLTYSEELGNYTEAANSFNWIIKNHPNSNLVPAAKWMLSNMHKEHPPLRNVEHVVELAKGAQE